MTHRVGAALVMYKGAQYGELLDTAAIIQERKLEFEIAVMMRDLGWAVGGDASGPSPGAYSIIEAIRAALTGFPDSRLPQDVPGARKIYKARQAGRRLDLLIDLCAQHRGSRRFARPRISRSSSGASLWKKEDRATITVGASAYTFNSNGQVQLPQGNVFAVSVTGAGGAALMQGTDFSIDRANGIVIAIPGGAITAGETVQIAYSYAEEADSNRRPERAD